MYTPCAIGVTQAYRHLYASGRIVEARKPPSFEVASREAASRTVFKYRGRVTADEKRAGAFSRRSAGYVLVVNRCEGNAP